MPFHEEVQQWPDEYGWCYGGFAPPYPEPYIVNMAQKKWSIPPTSGKRFLTKIRKLTGIIKTMPMKRKNPNFSADQKKITAGMTLTNGKSRVLRSMLR
jgi:hypothetical protein